MAWAVGVKETWTTRSNKFKFKDDSSARKRVASALSLGVLPDGPCLNTYSVVALVETRIHQITQRAYSVDRLFRQISLGFEYAQTVSQLHPPNPRGTSDPVYF